MVIWLLRFLRGYLDVLFTGVYSEKILSLLAKEKISVWRLKYSGGSISARIIAKDYKRLRKIRRNTDVKTKIIAKHGFPFFIRKYIHRSGFITGAIVFFIILKLLSTFVWVINIEGNKRVKSDDIMKTLNEIGIRESMKISEIDAKHNAQSLLLMRDDLAWAALNIEGCVLNVNISEIKDSVKDSGDYPTNLVAETDGIIRKIDAVSGDVMVKVGENVHRGDILVSGIIESLTSTVFVKSNAVITAQVEKQYSKRSDFEQSLKQKTGRVGSQKIIEILSLKIPLYLAKSQSAADISFNKKQMTLLGRKIPIGLYEKKYEYYIRKKLLFSEEELKNQLSGELKEYLERVDIEGYIPLGTEYITDDSGVTITHRYLCDEDIAVENKIIMGQ